MLIIKQGRLTGRLAIEKAVRAECIELHYPAASNLKPTPPILAASVRVAPS
jgi:hypothetical protein